MSNAQSRSEVAGLREQVIENQANRIEQQADWIDLLLKERPRSLSLIRIL